MPKSRNRKDRHQTNLQQRPIPLKRQRRNKIHTRRKSIQ
jgi:hypothetical protein